MAFKLVWFLDGEASQQELRRRRLATIDLPVGIYAEYGKGLPKGKGQMMDRFNSSKSSSRWFSPCQVANGFSYSLLV